MAHAEPLVGKLLGKMECVARGSRLVRLFPSAAAWVIALLKEAGRDGLPVGEILLKVEPDDQKVGNQLAQMTKKGIVSRHSTGFYQLPA